MIFFILPAERRVRGLKKKPKKNREGGQEGRRVYMRFKVREKQRKREEGRVKKVSRGKGREYMCMSLYAHKFLMCT